MDSKLRHLLVAGVTTRALAVSAARAGYRVTAIDAFGDLDLREAAEVILARPAKQHMRYGPPQAAREADRVPAELAAYTSNFENYPAAVARLSRGRRLLGNPASVLCQVRNPFQLTQVLRRCGVPVPETRSRAPGQAATRGQWVMKPRRSGGGHGVMRWTPGWPLPRSMYLQQHVSGIPGSVSFVADGRSAVVLGFSRQLVGDARLGAGGYRYCGSILGGPRSKLFPQQGELLDRAGLLAEVITREFGLLGVNGIDFIARRGIPYPLEVNPRFSASMELIERAYGISMFRIHADACVGLLPSTPEPNSNVLHGKGIVFARNHTRIPSSQKFRRPWMADVPHGGEHISQGRPICTVFAAARNPDACRRLIWKRAGLVYRAVTPADQWTAA